MFGIGSTELIVILIVALIVLGPKSLAKFAKSLGKAMAEFRKVSTDFQRTLNYETSQDELRAKEEAFKAKGAKKENLSNNQSTAKNMSTEQEVSDMEGQNSQSLLINNFPPDSPVAQAIAKAQAEANNGYSISNMQDTINKKESEVQKSGESHA